MAFWSILVSSDKPFTFTPIFDLKITQLVLPAAASNKDRTVLECTLDDQTFALGSLKLDVQENITTDILIDEAKPVTFAAKGNNPVQVIGYYMVDRDDDLDGLSDDDDLEGLEGEEDGEEGEEEEEEEEEEISEAYLQQVVRDGLNKRKPAQQGQQQNGGAKKVKIEGGEAKPQEQKEKPEKPQQPKAQNPKQQKQKGQGQQQQKAEEPKVEAAEPAALSPAAEQKPQQQKGDQKQQQQKQQKGGEQGTPKQNNNKQQQQQQKGQTPKGENAPQKGQAKTPKAQ